MRQPEGVFAQVQLGNFEAASIATATSGICAVIRCRDLCLEIHNGADPQTLAVAMRALGVQAPMICPAGAKIYLACGYKVMRKQIDGLAQLVEQNFKLNPFDNAFFLFCGRRCDRIKALFWDGDGFVLLYKRLDGKGAYEYVCVRYGRT